MLVLDISIDVGTGATPVQLEALVRAVRVAVDVSRSAELRRIRRVASERMKFPTNDELRDAIERLPSGDETSTRYLGERHLKLRRRFARDSEGMPAELLFDLWRSQRSKRSGYLRGTGFERVLTAAPVPWVFGAAPGLDVVEPALYQALVADDVSRLAPGEVVVRSIRYRNPFGEEIVGVKAAEKAVKTSAGVIETAATLGSRRKLARVEAQVAEATIDDRIEDIRLDRDLKQQQVRRARIENDIAEEELLAKRIRNAQALRSLTPGASQQLLVEHFVASGELDQADAIAAAEPMDAAALLQFTLKPPELKLSHEADDEVEEEG